MKRNLIGIWVRRFLLEYLVGERNYSLNTQASYRDTMRVFLPWAARQLHKHVDELSVEDLADDVIRGFLTHLENERKLKVSSRNQRLAAIHALAHFIAMHSPEHVAWCTKIRTIPFKKPFQPALGYLEKDEMNALLDAPDRKTPLGRRDRTVILFLYNTGARASEAASLKIMNLALGQSAAVTLHGKGNKDRVCPLWPATTEALAPIIEGRSPEEPVFLGRGGKRSVTRHTVLWIVRRAAAEAVKNCPSLQKRRVVPHTIRHTTAVHLLRAGVDINTIRAWLGHVSLVTTNIYAEVDFEMKAKALAKCEVSLPYRSSRVPSKHGDSLMEFLRSLPISTESLSAYVMPAKSNSNRQKP